MCISFEMNGILDSQDAGKLLDLLEKSFQKKKILRRIGWCANYVMDKNNNQDAFALDFIFLINHLIVVITFKLFKNMKFVPVFIVL